MVRAFCVMLIAVAIVSCSTVSSYRADGPDALQPSTDNAGSYFLAKHLLKVTVTNDAISVESVAVADKSALFQLGYNLSPFAEDDIKVEYSSSGLLKGLTSVNDDKSVEIAKGIATAIGTFRATATGEDIKVSELTFDPFNAEEARKNNKLLQHAVGKGTCVSVEIFENVWSPGCENNPLQGTSAVAYSPPAEKDLKRILRPVEPGIYYRRPLDHRVFVAYRGASYLTKLEKFANYAPVMRLDVKRTMLVKRETTIMFADDGSLKSVQVKKPSEALAVVTLPAALVGAYIDAVVAGLTNAKKVQDARAALYNAQAASLQAERKLLEAVAQGGEGAAGASRALSMSRSTDFSFRSGQTANFEQTYRNIAACQATLGATVDECTAHMQRMTSLGIN